MPKAQPHKSARVESEGAVRASISFPRDLYNTFEEIAKQKNVFLAWVVRDAAEMYVGEKWPLFAAK